MAKTTIKKDMDVQWVIDGDDMTWTLKKKAEISAFGSAVDVLATSEGNELMLYGDISAGGALSSKGVAVAGANTTILVGEDSRISGRTGIFNTAEGMKLTNAGEIDGKTYGIVTDEPAVIRNSGVISGETAIQGVEGIRVVNGKAGDIVGEAIGIEITGDYNSTIINRGMISGGDMAISVTTIGVNTLKNFGTIVGDVVFGNGIDVIDTRKGTVEGDIHGGWGADVYYIGDSDTSIVELAGQGDERVESWASYHLADNLEDLMLKGKADLNGAGNGEDNQVYGNKGDNRLSGGGGDDVLNGFVGDDRLIGDAGEDFFAFMRGNDRDTISGFEQGTDQVLMIFSDEEILEFADIEDRISQHGNDVWISMGQGDRLILKNTDISDVDETDFTFSNIGVA